MSGRSDVVVLGGGPAGYASAIRAAQRGASVAVVEEGRLGGTCLHRGCIPTKALAASASRYAALASLAEHGIAVKEPSFSYAAMAARRDAVVAGIASSLERLVEANGVEVLKGRGRLARGGAEVEVALSEGGSASVEAGRVIVATGSQASSIPGVAIDGERVLSSDHLVRLAELPSSLTVIGGGVIGCEWAAVLAALGTSVTVVELMPSLLPGADRMAASLVKRGLERRGARVLTGARVKGVSVRDGAAVTALDAAGEPVRTELALVCVGRSCCTDGLGLEESGVALERGRVVVDEFLRTSNPRVLAAGDVVGGPMLAHKAMREGELAALNALSEEPASVRGMLVPSVAFTVPEVASFGHTEESLRSEGVPYRAGRAAFAGNCKALCDGDSEGFVKVLVSERGRILGAVVAGHEASSLIGALLVPAAAGVTAEQAAEAVLPHPTLGEAVKEAVDDALGRALHKAPARVQAGDRAAPG